jgi:hypothetical protein
MHYWRPFGRRTTSSASKRPGPPRVRRHFGNETSNRRGGDLSGVPHFAICFHSFCATLQATPLHLRLTPPQIHLPHLPVQLQGRQAAAEFSECPLLERKGLPGPRFSWRWRGLCWTFVLGHALTGSDIGINGSPVAEAENPKGMYSFGSRPCLSGPLSVWFP